MGFAVIDHRRAEQKARSQTRGLFKRLAAVGIVALGLVGPSTAVGADTLYSHYTLRVPNVLVNPGDTPVAPPTFIRKGVLKLEYWFGYDDMQDDGLYHVIVNDRLAKKDDYANYKRALAEYNGMDSWTLNAHAYNPRTGNWMVVNTHYATGDLSCNYTLLTCGTDDTDSVSIELGGYHGNRVYDFSIGNDSGSASMSQLFSRARSIHLALQHLVTR